MTAPVPVNAGRVFRQRERMLLLAVAGLVLAATLPLGRVFVGTGFLWPILGAALVALGVDAAARRLGAGAGLTLLASLGAYVLFTGLVFLPFTLVLGLIPTPGTFIEGWAAFLRGLELIRVSPAPTFAEPELILVSATAVWAVAHAVDGLVFRLAAPLAAVVLALVLLTVPLALAAPTGAAWLWSLPFLAAAAWLLLAYAGSDLVRYGRWVYADDPGGVRVARNPLNTGGGLLATAAIVIGALVAGTLPGFADRPWFELRGSGGTALTTNPIVGIHSRLVSTDGSPVLRVTTPRPLYLRTTSLDIYDAQQEVWTSSGVSGDQVEGPVSLDAPLAVAEAVPVNVEVLNLPGGLLVPMPYQATGVWDSTPGRLRYDARLSTFYVPEDATLRNGDRFEAVASVPTPTGEQLGAVDPRQVDPALTQVPELPPEVGALARQIVDQAGATTVLEQALAIQNELRSWTYSLEVVPSHRRTAIAAFLENRTGYCEQFAATMAVMLRDLGIPARVAVGFTPGVPDQPELVGSGQNVTYTISQANAHAWVEVLFPGYGWIAFEPTPRSDGNVLVPSATNLAPATTANLAEQPQAVPNPALPENDFLRPDELGAGLGAEPPLAGAQAPPAVGTQAGGPPVLLAGLLALALAGAIGLLVRRTRQDARTPRPPLERVLRARQRVRRLGTATGTPPLPSETDREYFARFVRSLPGIDAGREGGRVETAAELLARRSGQALWARTLPDGAAEVAQAAATVLEEAAVAPMPAHRRLALQVRMTMLGPWYDWRERRAQRRRQTTAPPETAAEKVPEPAAAGTKAA